MLAGSEKNCKHELICKYTDEYKSLHANTSSYGEDEIGRNHPVFYVRAFCKRYEVDQ